MIQKYLNKISEIYDEKCNLYTPEIKNSDTYYRLSMNIEPFSKEVKKLSSLLDEFNCTYASAIRKVNNKEFEKADKKIDRLIAIKINIKEQISIINW